MAGERQVGGPGRNPPPGQPRPSRPPGSPWGPVEICAVILLTLGSYVLIGIGSLAGLVLVLMSGVWTRKDKLVVLLLGFGLPVLGVLTWIAVLNLPSVGAVGGIVLPLALSTFVTPFFAGLYLLVVTGNRGIAPGPRAVPPVRGPCPPVHGRPAPRDR